MAKRVLIVDDDDSIRYLVRISLETEGVYQVVGEAQNGDEAVAFVDKERPDFVIMDHMMPRMDGAEAAAAMRDLHPSVRIVAYSAAERADPSWADVSLSKEEFSRIGAVLNSLGS